MSERRIDAPDLVLRLSLVTLLLDPGVGWAVAVPVRALAVLGLLRPAWGRQPLLWAGLAALCVARIGGDWMLADNHDTLRAVWCGAVALSLATADPVTALARNGRILIGLVFLFATLWKALLAPDFVDGRAFRVLMLTDSRFVDFARLTAGLDDAVLDHNDALLSRFDPSVPESASAADPTPALAEPPRLPAVAGLLTFFTLVLEAGIAAAFLLPWGRRLWDRVRDPLLLGFCISTYAVATVAGFGWLLVCLGVAQCDGERRGLRALYLAVFVLVLVYARVPWLEALADRFATG